MTIKTRLTAALCLATLGASLVALPAAAAPRTRWVDDDGKAGPTSCDSSRAAQPSVIAALGVAGPGDTIKVCPGTYPGSFTVMKAGITIVGVKPRKAVIRTAFVTSAAAPAGDGPLVGVVANNVTVRGLRIDVSDPDSCWSLSGIGVQNVTGVVLRDNRIDGRTDASSLTCGLSNGIAASLTGRSQRLTIVGNTIRNHRDGGIVVGNGTFVINRNTVIWGHGPQIAGAGRPAARAFPAGGPSDPGIGVGHGSKATVRGNTVRTTASSVPPQQGGIALYDSRVSVRDNLVDGPEYGLTGTLRLRGRITENVLRNGSGTGLYLYNLVPPAVAAVTPIVVVDHNQVHRFGSGGMLLADSSQVSIHHNDFRNNSLEDCADDAIPTKSSWAWGTAGRNLGNDQNQPHLCKNL